jgi:putative ABC transport system permease protein
MVDEQRTQIGIYKALGYNASVIIFKYIVYALSASIAGGWLGVFVGSTLFPRVIYGAYMHMYDMPPIETPIPVVISIVAISVSVSLVMFVTIMSGLRSMRSKPAEMMRPKTPPSGKKVLMERLPFVWKRMKFTSKVTARNIFRYKKRFIMTLAGVSGCTAILITSFGLRDSLAAISDLQYDKLTDYALRAYIKDIRSDDQRAELDSLISGERLYIREESISAEGSAFTVSMIIPESSDKIGNFINFYSRITGQKTTLNSSGVLITEKLARELDISRGDQFTFSQNDNGMHTVNVSGVVENYVMHHIYMPPELYYELFGEEPLFNSILIATDEESATSLLYNSNVRAVVHTSHLRDNTADATDAMNIVAIVLIFLACALALVVLFNLTNINITERIRELATIKVLGFFNEELAMYIYRENSIVTLMGIALGFVCGIFLHSYVLMAAEIDMLMFPRIILPWSFIYSVGLTIAFAIFVNLIMNIKLSRIDMVESLKIME